VIEDNNFREVLDHGFVRLLNLSGPVRRADAQFDADDVDPAQAARRSFNQHEVERPREDDIRLNEYLIKNKHSTPIEAIETWWEMKLPIFVARQFVRHRTCTISEISARYAVLPEEWYLPKAEQVCSKAKSNKQGRGAEQHIDAEWFIEELRRSCESSYRQYCDAIAREIAPEVARSLLHVNHYTCWMWKQNLHNLFHFLSLRDHSHAQWESRQYAIAMIEILRQHLPELMDLYDKYRKAPK